jgi:hypothetical protein
MKLKLKRDSNVIHFRTHRPTIPYMSHIQDRFATYEIFLSRQTARSQFDHAIEVDDHQSLDRYAIDFALELARSIMFSDNSGDFVPIFFLLILMVSVIK